MQDGQVWGGHGTGRTWDGAGVAPGAACNGGNATARDSRREKGRGQGNVYHDGLSDASARPSRHWRKTVNTPNENVSMALFCDFENVALGVRDTRYQKFDIRPVLERLLLKGSIVVKKAYCDWERYKEFKAPCTRPISS